MTILTVQTVGYHRGICPYGAETRIYFGTSMWLGTYRCLFEPSLQSPLEYSARVGLRWKVVSELLSLLPRSASFELNVIA